MEVIIFVDDVQCIVLFNLMVEILFGCLVCQVIGCFLLDFIFEWFCGVYEVYVWCFGVMGVLECQMGKQWLLFVLYIDGWEFLIEVLILQIEVNGGKLFMVMLCDIMECVCVEVVLWCFQEELQYLLDSILVMCEEEWYCIVCELYDDLG